MFRRLRFVWVGVCLGFISSGVYAASLEPLGQPCRAKQVLAGIVVTDRQDGRERFVLANDNETRGCELLYIDFENNTGEMFPAPAGAGAWALLEVPGDRIIVGTFYDGVFMVFDLNKKAFIKVADFRGEQYIWNLALGGDGRVYGGTYPGGKLGALDLETYEVEDCGAPAPPNLYLRYVYPAPGGKIVCSFSMDKPTTLVFDPATKTFSPLRGLKEGEEIGTAVCVPCPPDDFLIASIPNQGLRYWKGADLWRPEDDPTDSRLPSWIRTICNQEGWGLFSTMPYKDSLILTRQGEIYRLDPKKDRQPQLLSRAKLPGHLYGVAKDGTLLGVSGQDYFIVKPGAEEADIRPIPVESRGRPSLFLEADARGRLWGGPHFGQTLFWYDTATKEFTNTGMICDSGGEVYDVTFKDGKVYAVSYSGGDITVYDPALPWDQRNHVNPKPLASVRPEYIRPTGGMICGPDGFLYSGWMAHYGARGGCIARTNAETGETEIWPNPIAEQAIESMDLDEKYIYFGTSLSANGLPSSDPPVHFGVWDIQEKKVVFQEAFNQKRGIGPITVLPGSGKVYVNLGEKLMIYDRKSNKFSGSILMDNPITTPRMIIRNGKLIFGCGKHLVQLDPSTDRMETIGEAPDRIRVIACIPDGTLYLMCEADLFRVME
ncbi:MAG TPA: hypothetical protein PLQ35_04365 [bacterium]|nr:hypothetical protein [bacterium]HQL61506.1 hypothetical protein [bacterium]